MLLCGPVSVNDNLCAQGGEPLLLQDMLVLGSWRCQRNSALWLDLSKLQIDLQGYGKSDKPRGDYNYNVFSEDVKTALEVLDLRDVIMAGLSMGGAIAMRCMGRHFGERVPKFALLGVAAPSNPRAVGCDSLRPSTAIVLI